MDTGPGDPVFEAYYSTGRDDRPRAFQMHRFYLPWVKDIVPEEAVFTDQRPELTGGNWSREKRLFFGEATCATCHSINEKGKTIGPDLSNLIYRDYNSVLKDIAQPSATIAKPEETLNVLWVSGPKDHGPDEHDYPLQQDRWTELLSMGEQVEVTPINGWPSAEQFKEADVVVFYWNFQKFSSEHGKQLDRFLQRGGGLVYLHYAVDATQYPKALADRIGLAWKGGMSKFRHGDVQLKFSDSEHPIIRGFDEPVTFRDESYWNLVKGDQPINVLATAEEDGQPRPILWMTERMIDLSTMGARMAKY